MKSCEDGKWRSNKKVRYSSVHIEKMSRNRYLKLIHIDAIKCKTYLIFFLFQGVKFESDFHKLGNDNSMKSKNKNRLPCSALDSNLGYCGLNDEFGRRYAHDL